MTDIATPNEILSTLTAIMRGDMTETTIRKSGGGETLQTLPPKVSERAKAAEMLGRQYGMFAEKSPPAPDRSAVADEIDQLLEGIRRG